MKRPRIRTALARFVYRLSPDRPEMGSELLLVKNEARRATYLSGQKLRIVSWNTCKGGRSQYKEALTTLVEGSDIVLLQEFRQSQAFDQFHQEIFENSHSLFAVSFYTLKNKLSPTGVYTASAVEPLQSVVLASRSLEPVTKTPKMALCTWYPLNSSSELLSSLLVVNCHGINFRLRKSFSLQVSQLREQLLHHTGPIIFVGDFNTWESGREKILDSMATELQLDRIVFPKGIKHLGGHQLDRVYVRGGEVTQREVHSNLRASDHASLAFDFTIA